MIKRNLIKEMYSEIKAPESAVRRCFSLGESKRTYRQPARHSVALAAVIVVLVAAVVSAGAYGIHKKRSAAESLDSYGNSLPYSEKAPSNYSEIFTNGNGVSNSDSAVSGGLSITPEETYYDGRVIYISFSAKYSNELADVQRFDYTFDPDYDAFAVEGESVCPTTGAFFLIKTEDGYSGALGLPFSSDKDTVDVEINLPYLIASAEDEEIGRVEGIFTMDFQVKKSVEALTYHGEKVESEVYVDSIYSTPAALEVTYFVPKDMCLQSSEFVGMNVQVLPVNSQGIRMGMVSSEWKNVSGGRLITAKFTPLEGETLSIIFYDKNNTDGCNDDLCVIKEVKDIVLG